MQKQGYYGQGINVRGNEFIRSGNFIVDPENLRIEEKNFREFCFCNSVLMPLIS